MIDTWKSTLNVLKSRVNDDLMKTWFQTMECVEITDTVVSLELDSDFRRDWVNANYIDLIRDAVREVTHDAMEVEIRSIESRLRDENGNIPVAYTVKQGDYVAPLRATHGGRGNAHSHFSNTPRHYAIAPITSDEMWPEVDAFATQDDFSDIQRPDLNDRYTFDSFVVGPSNQMIVEAARRIATKEKHYNPLFIYGDVGLGKTHLLHAIGHAAIAHDPRCRVILTSAEAFMNDMVSAIHNGETKFFRNRYRDQCDLLLLDDVQFLKGKSSTQGELFHTFNTLHGAGKQIVMTSDTPPHDLDGLDHRLTSRFAWGLSVDLKAPDHDTRVQIIRKKSQRDGFSLIPDVEELLASSASLNVRELEGALVYLEAQASFNRRAITLDYATKVLKQLGVSESPTISVDAIIDLVARHFGITSSDIKGRARPRHISEPRQIAMFLARRHTEYSYPELGRAFGGKDHTTVIAAYRKWSAAVERVVTTSDLIAELECQLLGK